MSGTSKLKEIVESTKKKGFIKTERQSTDERTQKCILRSQRLWHRTHGSSSMPEHLYQRPDRHQRYRDNPKGLKTQERSRVIRTQRVIGHMNKRVESLASYKVHIDLRCPTKKDGGKSKRRKKMGVERSEDGRGSWVESVAGKRHSDSRKAVDEAILSQQQLEVWVSAFWNIQAWMGEEIAFDLTI